MRGGLRLSTKKAPPKAKSYADYLKEYERKLAPIRKKRLAEAKRRRKARIKKGIKFDDTWSQLNPWTNPMNPMKDNS